ncbi:protein of unknown function DUF1279 [Macleaya cordata]|uniref:DUF1279 domain-containing protein n=1 Tax=Macleaya cordata TaxID=56857 RepID=A0A200QK31_MACCD|nr:protein of unknown function DUF1279 [Macleaya cordata]
MAFTGRFRELMKKYGKVALGVHFTVSAASITGLYVAINNNVDVESLLSKVGISGVSTKEEEQPQPEMIQTSSSSTLSDDGFIIEQPPISSDQQQIQTPKQRNRTAELAASSGGALALAVLCNKALFPVRVPITIALTPPIARFLARRKIIKTNV